MKKQNPAIVTSKGPRTRENRASPPQACQHTKTCIHPSPQHSKDATSCSKRRWHTQELHTGCFPDVPAYVKMHTSRKLHGHAYKCSNPAPLDSGHVWKCIYAAHQRTGPHKTYISCSPGLTTHQKMHTCCSQGGSAHVNLCCFRKPNP